MTTTTTTPFSLGKAGSYDEAYQKYFHMLCSTCTCWEKEIPVDSIKSRSMLQMKHFSCSNNKKKEDENI